MPALVFGYLPENASAFLSPDLLAEFDVFTEGGWPSADVMREAKKFIQKYHPNRSIRESDKEVVRTWAEGRTRALLHTALSEAGRVEQRIWEREEKYRKKREARAVESAEKAMAEAKAANEGLPRSLTGRLVFAELDVVDVTREFEPPKGFFVKYNTKTGRYDVGNDGDDFPGLKFFRGHVEDGKAVVDAIEVESSRRRQGVASAVMDWFEEFAIGLDAETMGAELLPDSLEFWKSRGWEFKDPGKDNIDIVPGAVKRLSAPDYPLDGVLRFSTYPRLLASMIDYPKEKLSPDVFGQDETGEYHILSTAKADIEKNVLAALAAFFKTPETWVRQLLLGSSIATQFYNPETDIDVKILVDPEAFKAANQEYIDLDIKLLKELWDDALESRDRTAAFGKHPYELRAYDQAKLSDPEFLKTFDALYDVSNDAWLKKAKYVDPKTYDREAVVAPAMDRALKTATAWDLELGEIRRDINELDLMLSDGEPVLQSQEDELLAGVADAIRGLEAEKDAVKDARGAAYSDGAGLDYINAHPDIIKMKLLVRWGYFRTIKELSRYLKRVGDHLTVQDVPALLSILETGTVEAALVFNDGTPGVLDIHAAAIDELLKLAKQAVQDDPRWTGYESNPALATQLGEVQRQVDAARSKDDLVRVWQQFALTPPLDVLDAESKKQAQEGKAEKKQEKEPAGAEKIEPDKNVEK